MTTDITELTPEVDRESGSILFIVAARMARREFFTPLHALCEAGKRVVSTRALREAVERAEEHMVSQVSKIVEGHDRLTKKLKEAESRNAELVEALEKAQAINAAAEKLVRCKGRYHSEQNYRALEALFGVTTPDLTPLDSESRTVTIEPFRSFVTGADLAALHRFAECCDDPESGGHDLEKEQVRRLEAIGALQRSGRISYITGFGDVLISITAGINVEGE
ncbi:hypothetical protein [Klebsiella michiganensis]|uniref:hypothetical protein n=1 Tax=Klebsiella michiganensis TaxID=1134687 RepID=UPI001E4615D9|nr:hypothetical protein [Klebsiella michiganensis]